ncbi:unnamed protein product [Urochloa decumbens]|uniref:KIB1-4 beta-propeller domain-containing protein n=1 Tax=Urochloa decumbens TaxID=240449 RepID=A0ABC9CMA8_9POAL
MTRDDVGGTADDSDNVGGTASRCSVDLPLHLTEKILCYLSPLVLARLAVVGKSWAALISDLLAKPAAPHLFVTTESVCRGSPSEPPHRRGFVVAVSLDGSELSSPAIIPARPHLADLLSQGSRCVGATSSGLLAFHDASSSVAVVLANPATDELRRIDVGYGLMHHQALKTTSGGGGGFFYQDAVGDLTVWRRRPAEGCDDGWSKLTVRRAAEQWATRATTILSVASSGDGGAAYILHEDGWVCKVDIATATPWLLSMERLPVPSLVDSLEFPSATRFCGRLPRAGTYLVESGEEILFVREVLEYSGNAHGFGSHPGLLVGFEVCRLDEADRRWARLERLAGDRALFVSPESAFSVRASETAGCRSGCVYFVSETPRCSWRHVDGSTTTWGVYSMEDGRVLFQRPVVGGSSVGRTVARWFLPNVR